MSKKMMNIKEFFKKNGLYLGLAVCVLGVGLAVFFGLGNAEKEPEEIKPPVEQVDSVQNSPIKPDASADKSAVTVSDVQITMGEEPEKTEEETAPAASVKLKLTKPLNGEIISAFSGDELVYNPTLNMWLTHNGVDISAAKDAEVKCALAGEVTKVEADETRGMIVEVSHNGGKKTLYCGLSEAGVSEGQLVNAGTVIGKAGTPAFEADTGDHLHFEFTDNGKYIDPVKYF